MPYYHEQDGYADYVLRMQHRDDFIQIGWQEKELILLPRPKQSKQGKSLRISISGTQAKFHDIQWREHGELNFDSDQYPAVVPKPLGGNTPRLQTADGHHADRIKKRQPTLTSTVVYNDF